MKTVPLLIMLICIYMLLQACGKDVKCVDFTATELSWIPYSEGQVVSFKSNVNNSVLKITAKKTKDTSEPNYNPYESRNDCTRYVDWWFTTTDSTLPSLNVNLHNRTGKNGQIYWVQLGSLRIVESGTPQNRFGNYQWWKLFKCIYTYFY